MSVFSEIQRTDLFSFYIQQIVNKPEQLIRFHMDGIFEIFMSLEASQREILTKSLRDIILGLDEIRKKRLLMIIPDSAKKQLKI